MNLSGRRDGEEGESLPSPPDQSLEEFLTEMHGGFDTAQDGLPSLEWLKDNYQTKSAAIRYLVSLGIPVKVIAKHLGVKYQHARNVATNPLKRGPNEDWRPKSQREPIPLLLSTTTTTKKEGEPK